MMNRTHKLVKWALASGTFVAVIGAATGCSRMNKPAVASKVEPAAVSRSFVVDPLTAPEAPSVNVFGEIPGANSGNVRTIEQASGFQQHTFADEGFDSSVAVDPTGKHIAFASTRHNEHTDIYIQRVDGVSVTRLTEDAADDSYPTFSPDGKQIAFCSNRTGSWQIYVMNIDGKNVTQVTTGQANALHPSYAPDGRRMVYSSLGARSNQWEIWTIDLVTSQKQQIGYGLFPAWSPNKNKDQIAFQRARQRGSRWFSLWTLDIVDGEACHLTEIAASANSALVSPTWSPDGTRLGFATIIDPTTGATKKPGQQDIWVIDADGTNRQRLTDGAGVNVSPIWASDNRIYFVSDRSGSESIWSAPAQKPLFNLTDSAAKPTTPSATTDTGEVK